MCKINELFQAYFKANHYSYGYDLQDQVETTEQVGFVISGVVSVNYERGGETIMVSLATEGDLINHQTVYAPSCSKQYTYIVETEEASVLLIPVALFRKELVKNPELLPLLGRQLSYGLIEASESAAIIAVKSNAVRVEQSMERLREYGITRVSSIRLSALTGFSRRYAGKLRSSLGYGRIRVLTKGSFN